MSRFDPFGFDPFGFACRQVTKSLKECVDVKGSNLHTNESHTKLLKTDDEIISVGQ